MLRPKWVMQHTIVWSWFTWKCVQLFLLFISLRTITKALLRRHWQLQRHLISCMPLTRFSPSFLTWSQFEKLMLNKFHSFLAHLSRIHYKELAHIRIIHHKELHSKMQNNQFKTAPWTVKNEVGKSCYIIPVCVDFSQVLQYTEWKHLFMLINSLPTNAIAINGHTLFL